MIIKGKSISSYYKHGHHLLKVKKDGDAMTSDWNDSVEIVCTYNLFLGATVTDGLREMAGVAAGSKCQKFLYASSLSPDGPGGRELTAEEAIHCASTTLNELGFGDNHQWLLMRHQKAGRSHFHICANRVDPVSLRAVNLGWNYPKHEKIARELEQELQLKPVRGVFTGRKKNAAGKFIDERPVAYMSTAEAQQAIRTGISVDQVITDVGNAWAFSMSWFEFIQAIQAHGYTAARGDRRCIVVVDRMGGVHSLAKRLGIKTGELKGRFSDLDSAALPSVDDVRSHRRQTDDTAKVIEDTSVDNGIEPERNTPRLPGGFL